MRAQNGAKPAPVIICKMPLARRQGRETLRYKLVIFDMDGTILDTLDDLADSLNTILKKYGYPEHSMENVRNFVGNGIRKLIERAVPDGLSKEKIDTIHSDFIAYYQLHCADKTKPYDGVVELIRTLRKEGVRTAVVSNKADNAVQELCKEYFDGLFDIALGEREGMRRKPAPDSVEYVLRQLQTAREDTVYIGDSEVDIQTAQNAGLDSIAVLWGFRDRTLLERHGAKRFAKTPMECFEFCKQKKALLITRVSGFIPQHEMNNVKILKEMGYEIHYATDLNHVVYGKDNSRLQGTGIITHQIDFVQSPFSPGVRKSYRQLKELMINEKFDLIHCHMPMSAVVGRLAAQSARHKTGRRIPVLYTAHGFHFFTGAPLRNWLYYPVERYLARYTDRLILINQEDYQRGKKFPIRGKVEYVPGIGARISTDNNDAIPFETVEGQDSDKIYEKPSGIFSLRERYGISDSASILLSVGEINANKNNRLMVEAMAELKDLDIVYVICGTGQEEGYLRERVQELGLDKKVILAGYVDQVSRIMDQADCFVLPSFREGLPAVIMEAMVAGLPVIASRIRGVTDLIEHGKGGYLVQGFDATDYAVKVRRMFTEKEGENAVPRLIRRQQMGEWNKERVKQFSLEIVEERMREIYASVDNSFERSD